MSDSLCPVFALFFCLLCLWLGEEYLYATAKPRLLNAFFDHHGSPQMCELWIIRERARKKAFIVWIPGFWLASMAHEGLIKRVPTHTSSCYESDGRTFWQLTDQGLHAARHTHLHH